MTGYYDYVLGLIPAALLGITALLVLAGISLSLAVPLASTVAAGVIGHAMFVNGPVDASPNETVTNSTPTSPAQTNSTPTAQPLNAD